MEDTNKTYRISSSSYYTIILAVVIIVIGIFLLINGSTENKSFVGIFYIVLGGALIFRFLNMPKEMTIEDGLVLFKNWFNKESSAYIKDFRRIRKTFSYLLIRTEDKTLRLPPRFNDLSGFVEEIKKINPNVEVSGVK